MKNWKLNLTMIIAGLILLPLFLTIAFDGAMDVYCGFSDWWNKTEEASEHGFDTFIKGITSLASVAVPILFFRLWSLEKIVQDLRNKIKSQ